MRSFRLTTGAFQIHALLSLGLLLFFPMRSCHGQPPANESSTPVVLTQSQLIETYLSQVSRGANRRVDYICRCVSMRPELEELIYEAVALWLENNATQQVANGYLGGEVEDAPRYLETAILQSVTSIAGPDVVKQLQRDQKFKTSFNDRLRRKTLVARLDLCLALDGKQMDRLEASLEDWETDKTPCGSIPFSTSFPRGEFPPAFKTILTPAQFRLLMEDQQQPKRREMFTYGAEDHNRVKRFAVDLQEAIDHRLAMLKTKFQWNAAQIRKLDFLAKVRFKHLCKTRQEAFNSYHWARDNGFPLMSIGVNPGFSEANMPAAVYFASDRDWTARVAEILDGEQQARYQALTRKRQQVQHLAAAFLQFRFVLQRAKLSGLECKRVFGEMAKQLERSPKWMRNGWDLEYQPLKMNNPSLQELLTTRQYSNYQSNVNNCRRLENSYFEAVRKGKAKHAN